MHHHYTPMSFLHARLLSLFATWTPCGSRGRTLTLSDTCTIYVELFEDGISVQSVEQGKPRQLGVLHKYELVRTYVRALEALPEHAAPQDFWIPGEVSMRLTEYRPGEIFFLYQDKWDGHTTAYASWEHARRDLPTKLLSTMNNER